MEKYLLSLDQGTTGTKALLINQQAEVIENIYQTHEQFYPNEGWVEHDPEEIWNAIQSIVQKALDKQNIKPEQIESVGLANQGETSLVWFKDSLKPVYPAVVWSDVRTEGMARDWSNDDDWENAIYNKTGLSISSYFSGLKMKWVINNIEGVKEGIENGSIVMGTLDSWILAKMTNSQSFVTDASTASRTMLYNIHEHKWDQEILDYLDIPLHSLAEVKQSVDDFGYTDPEIFLGIKAPISVGIVDQPAALYGHLCLNEGESKATYGTGSFVYMNVGTKPVSNKESNLLSSIVWQKNGETNYSLDGSVYSAGSSIDWARKQVGLYESIEQLQQWSVEWYRDKKYKNEVFFIPGITGLGAPFWNSNGRGVFMGMNSKSTNREMVKAVLEGIAHRVTDVLELLEAQAGTQVKFLNVDGKSTSNPYLMQYQANLLNIPVRVNDVVETTSLGVAYLQGEKAGWWKAEEIKERQQKNMITYYPEISEIERIIVRNKWKHMTQMINHLYSI